MKAAVEEQMAGRAALSAQLPSEARVQGASPAEDASGAREEHTGQHRRCDFIRQTQEWSMQPAWDDWDQVTSEHPICARGARDDRSQPRDDRSQPRDERSQPRDERGQPRDERSQQSQPATGAPAPDSLESTLDPNADDAGVTARTRADSFVNLKPVELSVEQELEAMRLGTVEPLVNHAPADAESPGLAASPLSQKQLVTAGQEQAGSRGCHSGILPPRIEEGPNPVALSDRQPEHGRVGRVWGHWLCSMQSDPEAALAAALAYRQQKASVREDWLSAIETDIADRSSDTMISPVAVYAPLMAVEEEPSRIARMARQLAPFADQLFTDAPTRFLASELKDGTRVAVVVSPLYLKFVQVLALAYKPGKEFLWVRHDPIACAHLAPEAGHCLEGERLQSIPSKCVIDEMAHTIVATTRRGEGVPEPLRLFSDVFFVTP